MVERYCVQRSGGNGGLRVTVSRAQAEYAGVLPPVTMYARENRGALELVTWRELVHGVETTSLLSARHVRLRHRPSRACYEVGIPALYVLRAGLKPPDRKRGLAGSVVTVEARKGVLVIHKVNDG